MLKETYQSLLGTTKKPGLVGSSKMLPFFFESTKVDLYDARPIDLSHFFPDFKSGDRIYVKVTLTEKGVIVSYHRKADGSDLVISPVTHSPAMNTFYFRDGYFEVKKILETDQVIPR